MKRKIKCQLIELMFMKILKKRRGQQFET